MFSLNNIFLVIKVTYSLYNKIRKNILKKTTHSPEIITFNILVYIKLCFFYFYKLGLCRIHFSK